MKEKKIEIEKVYTRKKNGVVPIMMKFQNGKLSAFTKENTHFTRLRSTENKNKLGGLLLANDKCYRGLINDTETSELTDTYICVRNKITNKMTLIPIDQVNLKNSIYDDLDQIKKSNLSEHVTKMTLLKKYGGRKASRYVNNQEEMKMDITLVQDDLNASVNDSHLIDAEEADNVDNSAYFDTIRPACNKDADKVSDVYQISDIIPADLLERLEEEAKTVYQTQVNELPIKSEYLKKMITSIQSNDASIESLHKLKIIIFMDCLLNLIKSRVRTLKKAELSKISEKVENHVRDRFADPNSAVSGARTTFSTEKALCHFIVLALLIEGNYQTDSAILSQELSAARARVVKYARIVYAIPKSKTSIFTLNIPKKVHSLPTQYSRKRKD